MAMGDPNWVSLLPGPPAENAIEAGNKGVLAGLQIGQAKAVRGALQNLDINNPASTNDAIGALVRAGALDQATGLMNLNFTRDLRSRVGPLMDKLSGLGGQQAPAQTTTAGPPATAPDGNTMTPDQHQHAADTMSQGVDALKQIRALPQEQRAAAFQQARQAFIDRGLPPAAVDAVGHDLSDAGLDQQINYLSAHGDHFGAKAQGQPAMAPTMDHPSQYAWASTLLSDPSMQLGLAMAKAAGLDLSGLTDTAKALVAPEVAKQAEEAHAQAIAQEQATGKALAPPAAPFGAVNVADPNAPGGVRVAQAAGALPVIQNTANAETTGKNTAMPAPPANAHYEPGPGGTLRVVQTPGANAAIGAQRYAESSGSAAGSAPYELVPGLTDPTTGAPLYRSKADLARGNVPSAGASPQTAALNQASVKQLTDDRVAASQLQSQMVPLRTAYDIIHRGGVTLGPGSEALNRARSFVTATLGLDQSQVANYDQVAKYLVQIANQRASQFGAGTNEKLAVAAHGSPNVDMSNLGAAEVLRMNIALARAEAAKSATYNGPPENYASYAADYGRTVDPRAFMLDMLSKTERKALLDSIPRGTPEGDSFLRGVAIAKSAGYIPK